MNSLRTVTLLAVIAAIAGSNHRLEATACTLDTPPAATLLLPYFEVDLQSPTATTTLFSIGNVSDAAALVNVTLWTDLGVPTLAFPVYLTGYDVETINLRDVLAGNLPRTASDGQDPVDQISPQGQHSQDINYSSCVGMLPPPTLPPPAIDELRRAHRGQPSTLTPLPTCAGAAIGDGRARGFVTVDLVGGCSNTVVFPSDIAYFGVGGRARSENILWGDVFYVDAQQNFARADQLVRVEAFPGRFAAGEVTFYGRFTHGAPSRYQAIDDREPLAYTWASRFIQGGAFDGGTHLVVWRDPGMASRPEPCGSPQAWQVDDDLVAFDEQENPQLDDGCPILCPAPSHDPNFPRMAQRVSVDDIGTPNSFGGPPREPIAFDFGWLGLTFFNNQAGHRSAQAWVGTEMSANGRYSLSNIATPLDSACGSPTTLPPER